MKSSILLVEDEEHLARGLRFNFEAEGYRVSTTATGEEALALLEDPDADPIDLVVLDVRLPGISGLDVLRRVRSLDNPVPILLLTARDTDQDIVLGLDAGADDYLTKPFSLPVLQARVRSLLRRATQPDDEYWQARPFQVGKATVYPNRFELEREGERHRLTAKELALLSLLFARRGTAVSRGEILEHVWDLHPETRTRVVDTFVLRLRKLIEPDPSTPQHLFSVRSFGYRLEA